MRLHGNSGPFFAPGSELSTHHWLQNISGLGELINHDFNNTALYRMYQVSDQLLKHKQSIEQSLFEKEKHLFSLKETLTLYDLTNTYVEGSGFPKRYKIFKGNVVESSTLSKMIKGLEGDEKAAKQYDIKVIQNEKTGNAISITWEKKIISETKDSLPGAYCLRTSHTDMNESDLWHTIPC